MANFITCLRIAFSLALLFFPPFSVPFYALYIAAGATDIADGAVARRTGTVSELGSKLDTAADIVMVAVCLIKLIPVLRFEIWMYIWVGVIAAIKAASIIYGFAAIGKFTAVHSVMNKIAGAMLFAFPLTLRFIEPKYSAAAVCSVATAAAISEVFLLRKEAKRDRAEKDGKQ